MKSPKNGSQAPSKTHSDTAGGPTARAGAPGAPESPYRNSPFWRVFDALALRLDHRRGWYGLPKPLGLLTLVGIRNTLRRGNLFDTTNQPSENPPSPHPYSGSVLTTRTADGSWNDLDHPAMGMAGTRFGRNVPIGDTRPEPQDRMLEPNPREVSRRLMTRDRLIPASAGNALIAAWLQFMVRDWFSHGHSPHENPWILPVGPGDDWPEPQLTIPRTPADPTVPAGGAGRTGCSGGCRHCDHHAGSVPGTGGEHHQRNIRVCADLHLQRRGSGPLMRRSLQSGLVPSWSTPPT
jgi:hypothetical protein